jgi:uncharacterized membrane protein
MTTFKRIVSACIVCAMLIAAIPLPLRAYLDPGTGSYILQIILAAILGGLFALKLFWHRIKLFLKRIFSRK